MNRPFHILTLLWLLTGPVHAATRVALVSTCGGDAGADVLALAEAKLSQEPGIELVERREVERVLQEQKLWRCGVGDAGQAVAAGRLLGVELFAEMEMFPGERTALGLVIFDAHGGVRVWDRALTGGKPDSNATEIVAAVTEACRKRRDKTVPPRTICLVAARGVGLPRGAEELPTVVGRLWERELTLSPDLAVLERRQLERINRESDLPTGHETAALLTSVLMVSLEVRPTGNEGGYQATAFLTAGSGLGTQRCEAVVTNLDAATLAHQLVNAATRTLKATPAQARFDRLAEARRFSQEAGWASAHGEYAVAAQAAEAALALRPESDLARTGLAKILLTQGLHTLKQNQRFTYAEPPADDLVTSLRLVRRGAQLRLEALRIFLRQGEAAAAKLPAGKTPIRKLNQIPEAGDSDMIYYAREILPVYRGDSGRKTGGYSGAWYAEHFMQTGDTQILDEAIAACRKNWRTTETDQLLRAIFADWYAYETEKKTWVSVAETPPTPAAAEIARLRAKLKQLQTDVFDRRPPKAEVSQRVEELRRSVQAVLDDPQFGGSAADRHELYQLAQAVIWPLEQASLRKEYSQALEELCDLIVAHGDVECLLLAHPTAAGGSGMFPCDSAAAYFPGKSLEAWERRIAYYDRVLELLDSPERRATRCGTRSLRRTFLLWRQIALRAEPARLQTTAPWTQARLLLDVFDKSGGLRRLYNPIVDGQSVYVLGGGGDEGESFLQLVRLPISPGPATVLGRAQSDTGLKLRFQSCTPPGELIFPFQRDVLACAIGNGQYFAAPRGAGILSFSTNSNTVDHIGTADGLPAGNICALAVLDGKLYGSTDAGSAGTCLFSCDVAARRCEVIASSRRLEKHSRFDNCPPVLIPYLYADAERNRLVFVTSRSDDALGALWEFNITTGKFRELQALKTASVFISGHRIGRDILALVHALEPERWFYHLGTDRLERIDDFKLNVPPGAPADSNRVWNVAQTLPPYLLVDNWLWSGNPFGRTAVDGRVQQFFPFPRKNEAAKHFFYPRECLLALDGQQQVLAGTPYELWLLTLPEKKP